MTKIMPTKSTRRELLKVRAAAWRESAAFATEQAASCRRSACLRSAEYWDKQATMAQMHVAMAVHELERSS